MCFFARPSCLKQKTNPTLDGVSQPHLSFCLMCHILLIRFFSALRAVYYCIIYLTCLHTLRFARGLLFFSLHLPMWNKNDHPHAPPSHFSGVICVRWVLGPQSCMLAIKSAQFAEVIFPVPAPSLRLPTPSRPPLVLPLSSICFTCHFPLSAFQISLFPFSFSLLSLNVFSPFNFPYAPFAFISFKCLDYLVHVHYFFCVPYVSFICSLLAYLSLLSFDLFLSFYVSKLSFQFSLHPLNHVLFLVLSVCPFYFFH